MEEKSSNCVFFDTQDDYDEDGKPIGAVKCDDKTRCEKCGHNPIVAMKRLMEMEARIERQRQK